VTITVQDTDGLAKEGLKVYAFNGTTYTGYNGTTDASGSVTLTLPQGNYRFRSDLNGAQFWSGTENHCTLPGCANARITTTKPVVVTVAGETGQPYAGLHVYAFDGTRYTGYNGLTGEDGRVTFTLPQGSYRFRADYDGVQFWSSTENTCQIPGCATSPVTLPGGYALTEVTIDYTYDPLYRLTAADYSTDDYYHYTYDAVGNRLKQTSLVNGQASTDEYVYDDANRLVSVNGVSYTWDHNGNMLSDGVNTYTYDSANRLIAVNGQQSVGYAYNGLGDRLQETANGQTTTFTMDLNAGLTQALSDGTNTYLYGNGLIAQMQGSVAEYFLGDALGSVRQLTNTSGAVTYASSYDPYGVVSQAFGTSRTAYGYTGEYTSNEMVYLRARYYDPDLGRFLTRDTWAGDTNSPMSLNRWNYVNGNPINYTDPTGKYGESAHGSLIFELVKGSPYTATINGIEGGLTGIASDIAWFDTMTDAWPYGYFFGQQNWTYHFSDLQAARFFMETALQSRDKEMFGRYLHRLQDTYAHNGEGYITDHTRDTLRAFARDHDSLRMIRDDFFNGGHWEGIGGINRRFIPSPYPAHPWVEVVINVRIRNPWLINAEQLSDSDLMDLYLRYDEADPNKNLRKQERVHFGFGTDKYIEYSTRDTVMKYVAKEYIDRFLFDYLFLHLCMNQ
jgi:RHS repeat-associated protein